MRRPEAKLWDYLDDCGIEFRRSMQYLIELFGHRHSEWSTALEYCEIKCERPFIDHLAHPLVFQYQDSQNLSGIPTDFFSYVRDSDDAYENLKIATDQLSAIFGTGNDNSASNTVSQQWSFGRASITATIFPRRLNKNLGSNTRHKIIPGSLTECSISVDTAYCPSPNAQEYAWLEGYERFYMPPHKPASQHYICECTRFFPSDLPTPTMGFGFSTNQAALISHSAQDYVEILPTSWIDSFSLSRLTPARGGGGAYLSVIYRPKNIPTDKVAHLNLASIYGNYKTFDSLAQRLSEKLNVPLYDSEQPDC